jgi:hypothetical protein
MAIVSSVTRPRGNDHFEPEVILDPAEQRALRGNLEQIDYTVFAANKEVIARTLREVDPTKFQKLALAAAEARAQWIAAALELSEHGHAPSAQQVEQLTTLRTAYDELTEAYEGMRRLVERGHLTYHRK